MTINRIRSSALIATATCLGVGLLAGAGGNDFNLAYWLRGWPGFSYNAQHAALSPSAAQPLVQVHWQTPVDTQPTGGGIHYASPLITARNNVLLAVKTQSGGAFKIECSWPTKRK